MSSTCQVLVVGAGPVGLLTALVLRQAGLSVIVVDRQPVPYPLPRALGCDHESQRILEGVGLKEQLRGVLEDTLGKGGEDGTSFCWRDKDHKLLVDLFLELPTRSGHPFFKGFTQPELEGLLEDTCLERGVELIRGYSVTEIVQDDECVRTTLQVHRPNQKHTNGTEEGKIAYVKVPPSDLVARGNGNGHADVPEHLNITSEYLVGSDGANSTVRKLAGFTTTNLDFKNEWLIIDLLLVDGYVPPKLKKIGTAQICDPARPTTVAAAQKGRRRFEFMRLPLESTEELLSEAKAWELLGPWGFNKNNVQIERKVIYTFHARWADSFYRGRIVLAGDSMHLMPPFIGQGLNSGFRDASALGWRLPLLMNGIGNKEALLSSYRQERYPHVRKLTEHCILLGKVVCETDPDRAKETHAQLRANPPKPGYDPPLGKPSNLLTEQDESGHLSLQRPLQFDKSTSPKLFDDLFANGWKLLTMADAAPLSKARPDLQSFFVKTLKGEAVYIEASADVTGEYALWFADKMTPSSVVIIRPDFYVYGHAPIGEIDSLLEQLHGQITGAVPPKFAIDASDEASWKSTASSVVT